MEKELSERFFHNVKWFNDFFSDLKTLFDRISTIIEKELGYSEKSYYYYKPSDRPSIPSAYFVFLSGEGKLRLQLVAILHREYITNKKIMVNEPTIFVVLHNWKEYNNSWITWNILEGKNIKQINEDNDLISGILSWETEIVFHAFQIPLDLFSKYKDQTVKEQIVSRINEVLNKKQ